MVLQTRVLDLALPSSPSPTWILCHYEVHSKVGRALHRQQTDLGQPFGITTAACADLAAFVEISFLVTQERPHITYRIKSRLSFMADSSSQYQDRLESVFREPPTVTVFCLRTHARPQLLDALLTSEGMIRLLNLQGCSSACNPRMTLILHGLTYKV